MGKIDKLVKNQAKSQNKYKKYKKKYIDLKNKIMNQY